MIRYRLIPAILLVVLTMPLKAWIEENKIRPGVIQQRVSCKADDSKSYALYLPQTYNGEKPYPLLMIFDPAGRATLPLSLLVPAAERYGIILVCSWNTQNYVPFDENWAGARAMWADVMSRFSIEPARVYATGFSGGARLASKISTLTGQISGLLLCGAGFWKREQKDPIDTVLLIGIRDFNFLEVEDLKKQLSQRKLAHQRIIFDGKHRWPPPEILEQGIGWLQLRAYKRNMVTQESIGFERQIVALASRAQFLSREVGPLEALEVYQDLIQGFGDFADLAEYRQQAAEIRGSRTLPKYSKKRKRSHRREKEAINQLLHQAIQGESHSALEDEYKTALSFWEAEAKDLHKKRKSSDLLERLSAQRIIANLGAFCFERSIFHFQKGHFAKARFINQAASFVRPQSRYYHLNLAKIYAQLGQPNLAISQLEKYASSGSTDPKKLAAEPLLKPLSGRKRFHNLLQSLPNATESEP